MKANKINTQNKNRIIIVNSKEKKYIKIKTIEKNMKSSVELTLSANIN